MTDETAAPSAEWDGPTPPNDLRAEQAVLGAMMLNPAVADEISEKLRAEDFYRPVHAAIFAAIIRIAMRGDPPDAQVVTGELDRTGDLGRIGGVPYMHTLMEAPPTAANGGWYADIVAEKAGRRRLLEAGTKIAQLARDPGDLPEVRERAAQAAYEATTDIRDRSLITSVGDMVGPSIAEIEDIAAGRVVPGIPTGLSDYDRLTGGHHNGELIIPAGRTGMGKSTVTQNWLVNGVRHTMRPMILFSVEMSKRDMMMRLLSEVSRVQLAAIRSGSIRDEDRVKLRRAEEMILTWPLYLVDDCRTTQSIRAYCRRFRQRFGDLAMIGVDYLQRLHSTARAEVPRHVVVGDFADHLKNLAQDMDMPVIAPCQLNRGPETRFATKGSNANEPRLTDLRESGNLEQSADVVVLLYRPSYYDKSSPRAGEADFIVAKQRNGPTDTVTVTEQLHIQRFADMAMITDEPRHWQ